MLTYSGFNFEKKKLLGIQRYWGITSLERQLKVLSMIQGSSLNDSWCWKQNQTLPVTYNWLTWLLGILTRFSYPHSAMFSYAL